MNLQLKTLSQILLTHTYGLLCVGALTAYLLAGGATAPLGLFSKMAVLVWALLLFVRIKHKLDGQDFLQKDFELGVLLALGIDVIRIRMDGGLEGPWSPLIYLFTALVTLLAHPRAYAWIIGWSALLETALQYTLSHTLTSHSFVLRILFMISFGFLRFAFWQKEKFRIESILHQKIEKEKTRLQEDARSYGLLERKNYALEDRTDNPQARAHVETIQRGVQYALKSLRDSLRLHTAAFLWLDESKSHLRIHACSTASSKINHAPFAAGEGVLGAVLAQQTVVSLANMNTSVRIPYYTEPCPVQSFVALPILQDGNLQGVLVMDRTEDLPFSLQEQELGTEAAQFCARMVEHKQAFLQLERTKIEQSKLYRAAQAFGAAQNEKDVLRAGVQAAHAIAHFDFAAITMFDKTTHMHEVRAVHSHPGFLDEKNLVGFLFAHNTCLVSMAVQTKCPLPYRGMFESSSQTVLTAEVPWPKVASLMVFPLIAHDSVRGTLILGAQRPHAFGDSVCALLEVMASHLAVSLSNAQMVHTLETLATTDPLTGLLNKRALMEVATEQLTAAIRFDRKLSLLMVDLDHFKAINDTYGHDVGDRILQGVGAILEQQKRATDRVARFGGEEFVVLCEQTDEHGALLLAERIREKVKSYSFPTRMDPLQVTCSLGIATFPHAGKAWGDLFRHADEALYFSKRAGRNQSTLWGSMKDLSKTKKKLFPQYAMN